jgi:hypothetical protein
MEAPARGTKGRRIHGQVKNRKQPSILTTPRASSTP